MLASGTAVLEAGDAIAMAMTELCDGEVILYSTDAGATAIQTHCAQGGRAVVSRDRLLVLLHGENEIVLGATDELQGGTLSATELLASAATGWALGISPAQLRGALKPATRPTATDLPQSSQNPTRSTAQLAALKRRVSSTTPEFTAGDFTDGSCPRPRSARPKPLEPLHRYRGGCNVLRPNQCR